MDLSIIIVSWNTRDLLAQCLESVISQRSTVVSNLKTDDWRLTTEIFVVDNASSDGSAVMVRERFPQVRLIENTENLGFARANNQVIQKCCGRYVLLLNSDALIPTEGLARLVSFMDKLPQAGAVGPLYINPNGTFQASFADFPNLATAILDVFGFSRRLLGPYFPSKPPDESMSIQRVDWIPGTSMLVRAETIADVGCLDEGFFFYSEEVDWCYRMRRRGWEIWFNPEVVVLHKLGESASKTPQTSLWHLYRGKLRFFAKHRGAVPAMILKWSLVLALGAKSIALLRKSSLRQPEAPSRQLYWRLMSKMMAEPISQVQQKEFANRQMESLRYVS